MFEEPTVIVLGAGASFEAGFPLGSGLLGRISSSALSLTEQFLSSEASKLYWEIMSNVPNSERNEYWPKIQEKLKKIVRAAQQAVSIDELVADFDDDDELQKLAKLLITYHISLSETNNNVFGYSNGFRQKFDPSNFSNTFYYYLFRILKSDVSQNSLSSIFNNVSFINFNYDRSLEKYLVDAISEHWGQDLDETHRLVSELEVFRPYGSLGKLPWQSGDAPEVDFGLLPENHLLRTSTGIRTIHELTSEDVYLQPAKERLRSACNIVFLGCAYHTRNLQILSCLVRPDVKIYGTTFGLSSPDIAKAGRTINQTFSFGGSVQFHPVECGTFMKEHVNAFAV